MLTNEVSRMGEYMAGELRAMRERCEKATPPPWVFRPNTYGQDDSFVQAPELGLSIAQHPSMDNGNFIASAREDVPLLLDEVERLRTENKRLRGLVQELHDAMDNENAKARLGGVACMWCGERGYGPNGLNHTDACPLVKGRKMMEGK